jgi:hypothetical protein
VKLWLAVAALAGMAAGAEHGSQDRGCAPCHRKQFDSYYGKQEKPGNAMARALYSAGPVAALERAGGGLRYVVSDGKGSVSHAVAYAFGQGFAGQTYVYETGGKWYESRLSYYSEKGGLDLTMGAPPGIPRSLEEAAGREMTPRDVLQCFACHTTNSVREGRVDFARLQAGVGCANCHARAEEHRAALLRGKTPAEAPMTKLSKWTAEELSEGCGRCHRTWADIAANGPRGVGNVRFQPYRLANSKCYDAEDRRIGCTACHDPHAPLEKSLSAYDGNCKACHTGAGKYKGCPQGKANCADCHMPRVEIPGSHHLFTDHMIRIARKNEPYPN